MKALLYSLLILSIPMLFQCSDFEPGEMRSPQNLRLTDDFKLIIEDANFVEIGNYGISLTDTIDQTTDGLYTADSIYILPTEEIDSTINTDYFEYHEATGIVHIKQAGTYLANLTLKASSTGTAAIVDLQNGVDGTWTDIAEFRAYATDSLDVISKTLVYDFVANDSIRLTKGTASAGTATFYQLGTKFELIKLK